MPPMMVKTSVNSEHFNQSQGFIKQCCYLNNSETNRQLINIHSERFEYLDSLWLLHGIKQKDKYTLIIIKIRTLN